MRSLTRFSIFLRRVAALQETLRRGSEAGDMKREARAGQGRSGQVRAGEEG